MEVGLVWALCLLIPLIVLIAFAGIATVFWVVLSEAKLCLRQVWRELRRRPQFGIVGIFSLTAVFALASAILGRAQAQPGFPTVFTAIFALAWALGAVCAVQFMAGDVAQLYRPRGGRKAAPPADPWASANAAAQPGLTPDLSWLSRGESAAPAAPGEAEPPDIELRD